MVLILDIRNYLNLFLIKWDALGQSLPGNRVVRGTG